MALSHVISSVFSGTRCPTDILKNYDERSERGEGCQLNELLVVELSLRSSRPSLRLTSIRDSLDTLLLLPARQSYR